MKIIVIMINDKMRSNASNLNLRSILKRAAHAQCIQSVVGQ